MTQSIPESATQDISCYCSSLLIKYMRDRELTDGLFQGIASPQQLEDPLAWTDFHTMNTLLMNVERIFGNKPYILGDIFFELTKNEINSIQMFVVKIIPLPILIHHIGAHFQNHINKNLQVSFNLPRPGVLDIFYEPIDRSQLSQQVCDINKGGTHAAMTFRGYADLTIQETACAVRSNSKHCHYHIEWSPVASLVQRIKRKFTTRFPDYHYILQHMDAKQHALQARYNEILKLKHDIDISRNSYRYLMESMREGIVWICENGMIEYANTAFATLIGREPKQLIDTQFTSLLALRPHQQEHFRERLLHAHNSPGVFFSDEFRYLSSHGNECIAETTYSWRLNDQGKPGFLISIRDITEIKRLNEQLAWSQRMKILGQLAGGFAHDFNSIVMCINSYGTLILEQTKPDKLQSYARTIKQASERAGELINKLRTFSNGQIGKVELCDINTIVQEAGDLLIPLQAAHINVAISLHEGPLIVRGDPGLIHQCVLNVCINARDALMETKEKRIVIATKKCEHQVIIEVSDTGCGIDPAIIDRIFDPFFSTKTNEKGVGLGLSVVYGIVKAHNGTISMESKPEQGSKCILTFPSANESANESANTSRAA